MIRSTSDPEAVDVQHLEWTQSPTPVVDEDGGQFGLAIGIIDVEDGAVASSDIDISSATAALAKSSSGGSFSSTGITQPSLSKAQGVVILETDFAAAEWAAGDSYRVAVSGITATTGDGNTVELPEQRWYGALSEESDITAQINTLHNTRIPDVLSLANIQGEVEDALEKDITNLSPTAGSVADLLDSNLDATVSSRSSHVWDPDNVVPSSGTLSTHDWDPDGVVPGTGTLATASDITDETGQPSNDTQTLYDILANDSLGNLTSVADSIADVLNKIRQNSDLTSDFSATDKNTDAEIRDGVWSDSTKAAGANLDAAVSSRSSHSASDVNGTLWKRQTPDEGQTSISDDTETTVADLGTLDGGDGFQVPGAYFDVALGSHGQIDLALKVEINGSRVQIGDTVNVTADGAVELADFNAGVPVTSPHVRVTATGDTASPSTNGTVDRTVEHSKAT